MGRTLRRGDMLPVRDVQPVGAGLPVRIGSNRPRAHVLVVTHADPCDDCVRYLCSLEAMADSFRAEKGDVLALVGPEWDARSCCGPAAVADATIRDTLAPRATPVVVVVDRFGQLFTHVDAGEGHSFPDHREILESLVAIAIRCPECGVPDVPSPDLWPQEGTRSGGMLLGQ